jgi:hypothetical protein
VNPEVDTSNSDAAAERNGGLGGVGRRGGGTAGGVPLPKGDAPSGGDTQKELEGEIEGE